MDMLSDYFEFAKRDYHRWSSTKDIREEEEYEAFFRESFLALLEAADIHGSVQPSMAKRLRSQFPNATELDWFNDLLDPEPRKMESVSVSSRLCSKCSAEVEIGSRYCNSCGAEIPAIEASELVPIVEQLNRKIDALSAQIAYQDESTVLPESRLFSSDFFTRAFAVFGHWFVIWMIFVIVGAIIALIVGLIGFQ